MATITITVAASALTELNDAVAFIYNYQATLPNGSPNPENKAEFLRNKLIEFLKSRVREYRQHVAVNAVDTTVVNIT